MNLQKTIRGTGTPVAFYACAAILRVQFRCESRTGQRAYRSANRDSYFQREDTTGGKVRFGTGVLWFSDWHALLLKERDIVKLHFDVLLERRSVATLFFLYATCVGIPVKPIGIPN